VRDLRELLTNWRRIRREATRSLITFGVRAILIFMVLMAAFVISTGFGTGIGR
jgi:nitrate reductase NapE component